MANTLFPTRPNPDESKIPTADKDLLSYTVAFSVPNQKAFALWFPEFLDNSGKLSKAGRAACSQFFTYAKNREYADAYRETLNKFLRRNGKTERVDEVDDNRKDKALKSLLNQAMSLVESGEALDPDTLKVLTEIFKKLGILKDEVEIQEEPRRYLPELCSSCRYRLFVENAVKEGSMIDECRYCKALDYAKKCGFCYNPTKLLNINNNETNNQNNGNGNMEH